MEINYSSLLIILVHFSLISGFLNKRSKIVMRTNKKWHQFIVIVYL